MTNIPFSETAGLNDTTLPSVPALDPEKYEHYLDDLDLTEAQERALLEALWRIMVGFVDMGFGVESVQNFLPELRNLSSEFRKNALDIEDSKQAENFNDVAKNRKDDFKCQP